ncbi:MAG: tetratricopeptide repeat protein [Bryobacteraceae bacterium]
MRKYANPLFLSICALGAVIASSGCSTNPQTYVDRGNKFFSSGKFEDAAIQFQKAIQKDPKLGEAHYRLASVYLKQNQPILAYRELQRAAELMPGREDVLSQFGQLALSIYNVDPERPKQLYDEATKAADQLFLKHPDGFDGNLLKGAVALIDRRSSDAVGYLRKAVQLKPEDRDAQLGLARALAQDNQAQAGISLALDLVQKDKAFGAPYDFLFEQYQLAGKTADAENILKLKVSNNPKQAAYILELARFYAAAQNPPAVNATVQKLVADNADFPDGRLIAGDFYSSVGRFQEALEQFQEGLGAKPKDPLPYRRRLARILAGQRKWPEALAQIDAILKEKPDDQDAKLNRALVWLGEGKPQNLDPAIAELRAQAAKRPKESGLHFELGNALLRKGDQDGARREWLAAAQQNKNYLPARLALVQMDLGQGKAQDALAVAKQMIDVAPRDARVRLWYATCLTAAGQFQQARAELDRLVSQFPKSAQIRFRQGTLALSEHKYKEAEDIFHKLETAGVAAPQVLAGLAEAYQGENEPGKAIQFLEGEVKRNPDSPLLRQVLAQFAAASGNYDLAIEQYKQAAAAAPASEQIQLALALVYGAKGNWTEALPILEKVVAADPKSAQAALQLSRAFVAQGRLNDAKTHYRRVLELDPNNPIALNDLAYLLADAGEHLDEALSFANKGLHNVSDPTIKKSLSDTLGWIYLKKNMNDSALQIFETLVKNDPRNATFRYHLAATLYQKGDKKQARVELEAALAGEPGSPDEPKIRELLARL